MPPIRAESIWKSKTRFIKFQLKSPSTFKPHSICCLNGQLLRYIILTEEIGQDLLPLL